MYWEFEDYQPYEGDEPRDRRFCLDADARVPAPGAPFRGLVAGVAYLGLQRARPIRREPAHQAA
jgi:hypothetical protein